MNGPPLVVYGSLRHDGLRTLSSYTARLLSSGQHFGFDRLLAGRVFGARRDQVLLRFVARGVGGDCSGPMAQSSDGRAIIYRLCPCRSDRGGKHPFDSGNLAALESMAM